MPPACARRFAAAIRGAHVVVGPGSHDWLITRPAVFAAALAAFADELVGPDAAVAPLL
jgi:hypothetical protein